MAHIRQSRPDSGICNTAKVRFYKTFKARFYKTVKVRFYETVKARFERSDEAVQKDAPHPTPYTLHPTPYTLLPTPYSLHPTPYTLHPHSEPQTRKFEAEDGTYKTVKA